MMRRYRHKARGTTYRILFEAAKASSIIAALDDMTMVVYQGEADGLVWVRPAIEFFDGRFEALSMWDQECDYCKKRHDPALACPEYVATQKQTIGYRD